ncbi:MAG: dicarboxylate/amino acid:cation symporter, partial [Myxococcales bacterium]|nr:dicarboxylate/amino acid:cation symporter [Myxococcales bacterium]
NSSLLEKDLYKVIDGASVGLRLYRNEPDSELKLPRGVPLELRHVETVEGTVTDSTGATHTVPTWVKVRFRLSERLLLRDEGGKLAAQLGNKKLGQSVEAWLPISAEPLTGGGFTLSPMPVSALGDSIVAWAQPIGKLFMRLIKMVIVPLVFASLLVGVASLGDVRKLGRLGGKTLGLYMLTTAVAVTIGLIVAHVFQPGSFIAEADRAALLAQFGSAAEGKSEAAAMAPSAMDNVLAIIPLNPIESLASGNMLQIIFFAVILGVALTMLGEGEGKPVVNFFDRIQNAMIVVIHMVMAIAPYGVAALVAEVVGTSGFSVLKALLVYGLVVVAGLALQATLVYGGLVKVLARMPLIRFMKAIRPAQLIAFSTSSSSAALPVSMECAEENLGVSNSVSSFVLPLGSTVNMDGTALYQGVAAIFIAQVFQMDLTLGDQLSIVLAATMASVGAAGVPGAGMVTLAMVLTAAGIPQVGLALILGMDRLLDMFRTAVNVTGDLAVTSVMAVSEGENLDPLTPEADKADPDRGFEGRLDHDPKPVEPD